MDSFRKFPLIRNRKEPLEEGWQYLATTDPKQIAASTTEFPDCNWGIPTGNGFMVLDVDNKKGKTGSETLRTLSGFNEADLDTLTVETPNAGYHYYFELGGPVGNRTDFVEDCISAVTVGTWWRRGAALTRRRTWSRMTCL